MGRSDDAPTELRQASGSDAEMPLGKYLASPDKRTRDAAVRSLGSFLASRAGKDGIDPLEMAKLWKGIFYCFWMSDKPLVQQALAQQLSDLVLATASHPQRGNVQGSKDNGHHSAGASNMIRLETAWAFWEGFWDAMVREWPGLDKWRINKFLLLIRRFLNAGLRLAASQRWATSAVLRLNRGLASRGRPLCATDAKVPAALTYHVCDTYLEELGKAVDWGHVQQDDQPGTPLLLLLQPFVDAMTLTSNAALYEKVMDEVLMPILDDLLAVSTLEPSGSGYKRQAREQGKRPSKQRKLPTGEGEASGEEGAEGLEDADDDGDAADEESDAELSCGRLANEAQDVDEVELEAVGLDDEEFGEAGDDAGPRGDAAKAVRLRAVLFNRLFLAASRAEANDSRRKRVYALYQAERTRRENGEARLELQRSAGSTSKAPVLLESTGGATRAPNKKMAKRGKAAAASKKKRSQTRR